jgi:Domain of unknown function (DUF4082)
VTFNGESASGWQTINFPTPVPVTAGTVFVASYHTEAGGYSVDSGFFANSEISNGPLHILKDGDGGGNGVFRYGTDSAFPSSSFKSTNYWIDVLFSSQVTA